MSFVIEALYPEIADLYGEQANLRYLADSIKDCRILETPLTARPAFLDPENKIDLVYMGSMSEDSQRAALEKMRPLAEEIKKSIQAGTRFFVTGNALELFGREILDDPDGILTDAAGRVVKKPASELTEEELTQPCLGIFSFVVHRNMMNRFNSLYLGERDGISIVGFKSQFTRSSFPEEEGAEPLFRTVRGPGLDNEEGTAEGFRIRNFMATYLLGPFFVLNPPFMVKFLEEAGCGRVMPYLEKEAMDAYRTRLEEYREPGRGFRY